MFRAENKTKLQKHLFLILFSFPIFLFAQGRFSIYGGAGSGYYQGDLAESNIPNPLTLRASAQIGADFHIYKKIVFRYHLMGTTIYNSDEFAEDRYRVQRGLMFSTNILQGGFQIKINRIFGSNRSKIINYAFLGTDLAAIDVTVRNYGSNPMVAEGKYSTYQIINPMGVGLGYWLSIRCGLIFESTFHFSYTDYLDGISYNGSPKGKDTYVTNHLVLLVRLGKINRRGRPSSPYKFHLFDTPINYR